MGSDSGNDNVGFVAKIGRSVVHGDREGPLIRTFQFSSQSPIRHRIGVLISTVVMFGVAIWLVLPIPVPSMVAPLAIASIGWATWMWVSNLQKRI